MTFQQEVRIVNQSSLLQNFAGCPLLVAFEKLEVYMRDNTKIYFEKVELLMSVLENVINCLPMFTTKQIIVIFQFLYKYILSIILHGDWLKKKIFPLHMRTIFKRFEVKVSRRNIPTIADRIKYILEMLNEPWGFTIRLLLDEDECTEKELLDLVTSEIDYVIKIRLEVMISAHCEYQALQLTERFLQCINNPGNKQLFLMYLDEITTLKDIYLLLLVKENHNIKLSKEVLKMELVECLKLVHRCTNVGYLPSLNKSLLKMVGAVTNMVLASSMIQPVCDEVNLEHLIEEWCTLYTNTSILFHLVKLMSLHAMSTNHIYLLLKVLINKYGTITKSLCIELYIRAFTITLNDIEKYKSNCKHEKVTQSEVELSTGFLSLADYIKDDIITCRECVLTSYSLHPTTSCFEKLKELAIASGEFKNNAQYECVSEDITENIINSSNCQTHEFVNHDEVDLYNKQYNQAGQQRFCESVHISKIDHGDVSVNYSNDSCKTRCLMPDKSMTLINPIRISDANKLGIPQTLCDDLYTVISSGRCKLLNWNLDWKELSLKCHLYRTSGKNQFRNLQKSRSTLPYVISNEKDFVKPSKGYSINNNGIHNSE